ncbi:hypothetical protein CNX65_03920 [Actinosynnema pretiosum]|uniref:Uncharacterized protein n=1 Tax=Actinosynnema pretiosum TaxID=42197 RepID=A0A290Z0H6_9PSEU|nr:hypothetical protein CNX65_03920 [Actinosynnema pretiosum]
MTSSCRRSALTGRCLPIRTPATVSDPRAPATRTPSPTSANRSGTALRRSAAGGCPSGFPDGSSIRCSSDRAPTVLSASACAPEPSPTGAVYTSHAVPRSGNRSSGTTRRLPGSSSASSDGWGRHPRQLSRSNAGSVSSCRSTSIRSTRSPTPCSARSSPAPVDHDAGSARPVTRTSSWSSRTTAPSTASTAPPSSSTAR